MNNLWKRRKHRILHPHRHCKYTQSCWKPGGASGAHMPLLLGYFTSGTVLGSTEGLITDTYTSDPGALPVVRGSTWKKKVTRTWARIEA